VILSSRSRRARFSAGLFIALVGITDVMAADSLLGVTCQKIGGRLRSVGAQTCLQSGLVVGNVNSVRGVPILYRDYEARSQTKTPYRVMLIGGTHGDELTSVSMVFQWMQRLEKERFQPFQWRVVPCLNPDGLLSTPSTRVNANGVDLNRNFPTKDWNERALTYWKTKTRGDKRRYPGASASSEPETRGLMDLINNFRPDAIVSIHAPYGVLDFDGPRSPPLKFGYLRLQLLGTYPGSLGNYAGTNLGFPVITLELPSAGIMPTPAQQQSIWGDMLDWLNKNLPKRTP
jgi:protein MpaA